MESTRTERALRRLLLTILGLLALAGTAAYASSDQYTVHRATTDDLTQQCVSYSAGYLFWTEALETYHEDGTVTHSPYLGRCLHLGTRKLTDVDPSPDGLMWLTAGGGWAVYQRADETTTIRAYNPADGSRVEIAAPEGVDSPPVTDGTHVVWQSVDGALWAAGLADGRRVRMDTRALGYPMVDAGRVSWVSYVPSPHPDGETGDADAESTAPVERVNVWDIESDTTTSVAIPGFSPMLTDISGPRVIVTGETPDYRSHLYTWDTRTGEVRRALSAYPRYVSRSYVSGDRVVMGWTASSGGGYQVRVLDLRTGAVSDVTSPEVYGLPWSFEGSTLGMTVMWPQTTLEAAWCDLDERPATPAVDDDDGLQGGGTPATTAGARSSSGARPLRVTTASQEPTAVVEETTTTEPAESSPATLESTTPTTGTSAPETPDDTGPRTGPALWWVLAAAGGLVLLGGAGTLVRRYHRSA